jgi:hypothetical protein
MSGRGAGLGERIERSRAGRVVISVVLVLLLTVVIIMNGQPSTLREEVTELAAPVTNAVGLDQAWGVFAPDPRNMSLDFFARVSYDDGTTETWRLPEGGPLFGDYWDYRWRKYLEYLVQDPWASQTHVQFSSFIARDVHRDGRTPTRVVLVRQMRAVRPGKEPPMSPVREQAYFSLPVTDEVLAG